MRQANGFTLIELLVVIAISAILLAIAIPNLSPMIERNRATSQANDLLGLFNLARAEAIRRGQPVGVCRTADPNAAPMPVCTAGAGTWASGALVYVVATGEVLRVMQGLSSGSTLTNLASLSTLNFGSGGTMVGAAVAMQTMTLANAKDTEGRLICVQPSGRSLIVVSKTNGKTGQTTCS